MSTKGDKTREAILQATVKLLDEADVFSQLQIRDIAREAGVSDGSPNYYFGSKDNLVSEAVYSNAESWLKWWFRFSSNIELPPEQKIWVLVKNLGNYYSKHPNLVKTSLQNDLFMRYKDCIRSRFITEVLIPLNRELAPHKTEEEIKIIAYTFADTFDLVFLRAVSAHPDPDFDYFNKQNRDKYFDKMIGLQLQLLKL